MSNLKTIHVIVFGIGNVGSTLIQQISVARSHIKNKQHLDIKIPVITNSNLAFSDKDGISNSWKNDFTNFSVPFQIEDIIRFVKAHKFENLIAVDATASVEFVQHYIPLITNGFNIVSANKLANTLHFDFYKELRLTLKKYDKAFLYETHVGAGLPIIETVKNLYNSGDQIQKIRGVFSGSLSYIFNTFSEKDVSFSKVLNDASNLGLTEPDPREDLSGQDVAKKLLILARELHLNKEFNDVSAQSLVPKKLNGKTNLSQFKERVDELNDPFEKEKKKLLKNEVLRYVGELDVEQKSLQVKLVAEDKNTPLGSLEGTDSYVEIFTKSYGEKPLIIQGAGAGKSVTARGLFSDIVKLSNQLN